MSYSFAVAEKDILLKGSNVGLVYGKNKLLQDLTLWLTERYRSDRFHSNYGSILDNFIGDVIDPMTAHEVEAEVERVLQNYQMVQYRRMQDDPTRFSPEEVLVEVTDVKAKIDYDSVVVVISIVTGSRARGTFRVGVSM